jgi:hypothetical protein
MRVCIAGCTKVELAMKRDFPSLPLTSLPSQVAYTPVMSDDEAIGPENYPKEAQRLNELKTQLHASGKRRCGSCLEYLIIEAFSHSNRDCKECRNNSACQKRKEQQLRKGCDERESDDDVDDEEVQNVVADTEVYISRPNELDFGALWGSAGAQATQFEQDKEVVEKEVERAGNANPHSLTMEERGREATRRNLARRDAEVRPSKKFCTHCLQDKEFDAFGENLASIFGRQSQCRACMTYGSRRIRAKSKVAVRCISDSFCSAPQRSLKTKLILHNITGVDRRRSTRWWC